MAGAANPMTSLGMPAPARRGLARATGPAVSLAAMLDRLTAHVPAALITPRALARVRNAALRLPAALGRWLYLECRLDADATQTDLIVNVEPAGREVITGRHPVLAPETAMFDDIAWHHAAALAREWSDASSILTDAIESLWLEFDIDAGLPRPSVFVDFTEPAFRDAPDGDRVAMIERIVRTLRGSVPASATTGAIRRCVASLPATAVIPYIGVMGARASEADRVRVCVHGLATAEVLPYLRAVRWPGDAGDLADMLAALGDTVPPGAALRMPSIVHLDVGTTTRARVGLEYTFDRRAQLRGVITDTGLLARLESLSLVTAAKARALALWGGYTIGVQDHEVWESVTARWVNHVKVLCGDGSRSAKAYLSAHDRPRAELRAHRQDAARGPRGAAE